MINKEKFLKSNKENNEKHCIKERGKSIKLKPRQQESEALTD